MVQPVQSMDELADSAEEPADIVEKLLREVFVAISQLFDRYFLKDA